MHHKLIPSVNHIGRDIVRLGKHDHALVHADACLLLKPDGEMTDQKSLGLNG